LLTTAGADVFCNLVPILVIHLQSFQQQQCLLVTPRFIGSVLEMLRAQLDEFSGHHGCWEATFDITGLTQLNVLGLDAVVADLGAISTAGKAVESLSLVKIHFAFCACCHAVAENVASKFRVGILFGTSCSLEVTIRLCCRRSCYTWEERLQTFRGIGSNPKVTSKGWSNSGRTRFGVNLFTQDE